MKTLDICYLGSMRCEKTISFLRRRLKMRYGFQTRPLLSGNLTYLDLGNLLLFCAAFGDTLPTFLLYRAETKAELVASQLLHLLVCWISKGRAIFAPQKRNVPRSELYIMSKYEKTVSRMGAHEINCY